MPVLPPCPCDGSLLHAKTSSSVARRSRRAGRACGGSGGGPESPRPDPALQRQLEALAGEVRGVVGIYVRNLRTGQTVAIRADEAFPTASMIKVPILVGTFDAIARGRLSFDQPLVYTDSLLYEGHDLIGALEDSATIPLSKLALLMITTSDNTASLWLQGLVGGAAINEWLGAHGFDSTRVNSRVPGREDARTRYGWGQTTPREIAELLVMIRDERAVSPAASQEMYRHLTRIYWNGEALSRLPPWVQAASKQGAVDQSKSEVVLVNGSVGRLRVRRHHQAAGRPALGGRQRGVRADPKGLGAVCGRPSSRTTRGAPRPGWRRSSHQRRTECRSGVTASREPCAARGACTTRRAGIAPAATAPPRGLSLRNT